MGEPSSTSEVVLVLLEFVRDYNTIGQLVVRSVVAGIANSVLLYQSPIRAEKIVRSRPDNLPFAFLMPSRAPTGALLEVVVHVAQTGVC